MLSAIARRERRPSLPCGKSNGKPRAQKVASKAGMAVLRAGRRRLSGDPIVFEGLQNRMLGIECQVICWGPLAKTLPHAPSARERELLGQPHQNVLGIESLGLWIMG